MAYKRESWNEGIIHNHNFSEARKASTVLWVISGHRRLKVTRHI